MPYAPAPGVAARLSSLPTRPPAPGEVVAAAAPSAAPPPGFINPFASAVAAVGSYGGAATTATPPAAIAAPPNYSALPSWGNGAGSRGQYPLPQQQQQLHQRHLHQPQSFAAYAPPQPLNTRYGADAITSAVPQIRNPFPVPGSRTNAVTADYDPEMAAAIAQWQSAYVPRDLSSGNAVPGSDRPRDDAFAAAATAERVGGEDAPIPAGGAGADGAERKKTVIREGGGKKWTDDTLVEWDPAHLRLFVGNLGGETTDHSLLVAFSRWQSVQKARVIRDKRTNKSKGYGFVSFSDPDEFFRAAKEMTGKYIGSHPVVIRKATTEIKVASVTSGGAGPAHAHKRRRGGAGSAPAHISGSGGGASTEVRSQNEGSKADSRAGLVGNDHRVTKPGQKTKNGLRLLG